MSIDSELEIADLKIVCLWALETWLEDPYMGKYVRLSTLLKSQTNSPGGRTFFDYLEDADAWACDRYGEGWRELMTATPATLTVVEGGG